MLFVNIADLQKQRVAIANKVKVLSEKEGKGEQLSEQELSEFKKLNTDFQNLTSQIERAQQAENIAAATAVSVDEYLGSPAVHVKTPPEDYPGAKAARFAMAIAAGDGDMKIAHDFALKEIGDKSVAIAVTTADGSGGALVPEPIARELIELQRPRTVIRSLGARPVPMPNGKASFKRQTSGATSSYKGESQPANAENIAYEDVNMTAKTQITIVPVSNELIGYADYNTEQLFLNDMTNAMSTRQDKAGLRDDGTNNTPIGLKPFATTNGNALAWSGTVDIPTVDAYLGQLILNMMNADSAMISPGWVMSPRTYMFLQELTHTNGNKVYPSMSAAQPMLKGYPIRFTTLIPINLGVGGDESEIYLADWNDVLIGETGSLTMDMSREATYLDANGNPQHAFSNNESVLRVVSGNDIGFRHPEGIQVGTGINWKSAFAS